MMKIMNNRIMNLYIFNELIDGYFLVIVVLGTVRVHLIQLMKINYQLVIYIVNKGI